MRACAISLGSAKRTIPTVPIAGLTDASSSRKVHPSLATSSLATSSLAASESAASGISASRTDCRRESSPEVHVSIDEANAASVAPRGTRRLNAAAAAFELQTNARQIVRQRQFIGQPKLSDTRPIRRQTLQRERVSQ